MQDESVAVTGTGGDGDPARRERMAAVVISSFDSPGNPHYGGGGAAVVGMIARWLAADFEVTVVTAAHRGGTVIRNGVRYRQLPVGWAGPRLGQLLFHALLPFVAWRMPHDLWIESFTPPFSTSFLPLFSRGRVVGLAQNLSGEEMWARYRLPFFLVERFGLRFYRHVVVLNPADRAKVRRYSPSATVQVIPNCIDLPLPDEQLLGLGEHILFLGRIDTEEKGLDLLLAAYRRSGLAMPLLVAGGGTPREERRLAALLAATGGDVNWLGHINGRRKQELLRRSAFVVLPSRYESFGLAALEGMSCGKPVVHFDLPSLEWIAGDVRVPPFDVGALANEMRYLASDERVRRELGRTAQAAAQRYSPDETAGDYLSLIRQILDEPAAPRRPHPALLGDLHSRAQRWYNRARRCGQSLARGHRRLRERVRSTRIEPALAPARQAGLNARAVALVASVAGAATLLIRLALDRGSFDLFGDEVIYTDIGRSVISGGFPRYYGQLFFVPEIGRSVINTGFPRFGGEMFFLHGPSFFYLEAGWARLLGSPHSLLSWIYEMRLLNALLAGATAVVLVLLATRAGSLWAGGAAGLLYAVEPYCIRQNDRVLLETGMMLWVLLGYLIFVSLIGRRKSRGTSARAVVAGLLFGIAVLTKDEAALLTLLPLLVAAVLRWGPGWRLTRLTVGTAVLSYVAYLTVVAANGRIGVLWASKTSGIRRMLGLVQVTGFHSQGGGSLQARLLAEVHSFGTTYAILALAVPAALLTLLRGGQLQRMLGLMYCAAAVALGYALAGGALEEQELYLLTVPSLLVIPVAASLLRSPRLFRKRSAVWKSAAPLGTALALVLGVNLATCVQWWRHPDNGISRLLSYMAVHVPATAKITSISGGDAVRFGLASQYYLEPTLTAAAAHSPGHIRYVVVAWGAIHRGYSRLTVSQARHIVSDGRLMFSFNERSYGDLALYRLHAAGTPPANRHQAGAGTEAAVHNRAAAWVAGEVSRAATVSCDRLMCQALEARHVPAASLLELKPGSADPLRSSIIVATAAARGMLGSRLVSDAPAVIASFGSGSARIDIRAIAPRGAAAYSSALRADMLARKTAGTELSQSPRITMSPAARRQLADGRVDARLLITIASLAAREPLSVVSFGDRGPGVSRGIPFRSADLAAPAGMASAQQKAELRWMSLFLRAQRAPYLAAHVRTLRLAGSKNGLRVDFAAPYPLGLLSPPSP
jgi:glycosyltransferase involved in cell wall biosynthesis